LKFFDMNKLNNIQAIKQFEQTSLVQRLPYQTTWDLLAHAAEKYADKKALSFLFFGEENEDVVTYTYSEFFSDITRCANALHACGVGDVSPVSIILPNLPETHLAIWGAQRAGVANPINPLLDPEHMTNIIQAANSETVITIASFVQTDLWERVSAAVKNCPRVKHLITVDMAAYLPLLKRTFVKQVRPKMISPRDDVRLDDFRDLLKKHDGRHLTFDRKIGPDTVAALFHTGGTTGVPKLARHTHLNEAFEGWIVSEIGDIPPEKTILCGLPLFHVNGITVTGLAAFARGFHVLLATPQGYRNKTYMENFWKHIQRHKVNLFSGVPTLFAALLEKPIDADVSSLEYAFCGAAPLPQELMHRFEKATGLKMLEGYGLTEGGCISTISPFDGLRKQGSVGLRIPYQELKAAVVQKGQIMRLCLTDEIGEIIIRGPNVFAGYVDVVKNAGTVLTDGWLATGDLGYVDADGYLFLTGRSKDLIIRGGHNIDPALIEDTLSKHPEVALAAAVGMPDAYAGELPVAYVSLRPNSQANEASLLHYARQTITERAAIPAYVKVLAEMPVSAIGKTLKPPLRVLAAQRAIEEVIGQPTLEMPKIKIYLDANSEIVAELNCETSAQQDALKTALGDLPIKFCFTVKT
jgi:fatty-acyl-CoA synthase